MTQIRIPSSPHGLLDRASSASYCAPIAGLPHPHGVDAGSAKYNAGGITGQSTGMRTADTMKILSPHTRAAARWLIAALAIALAGCAAIQKRQAVQVQQLLAAAGFERELADTPERLAKLQRVEPQRKVFSVAAAEGPRYVYADAEYCQCAYYGDQRAYARYQRMVIQQRLADEQDMAAQMGSDAAMSWGPWSPW
jgi:hypothetical protein